jgi:hypothetical protein
MKTMVSVPFISRTPCANRPTSFANTFSQMGFRSGLCNSWRYSSCWHVATSLTLYALLILGSGVARSWYARSSCVTCGGRCPLGLRRAWTWVGSVGRSGVECYCTLDVGTIGVSTLGVGCGAIFGVGSVRSIVAVVSGAIYSKIATNFFIDCILSMPGRLNGVVGSGLFKTWVSSNTAIVAASTLESPGTLQCRGKNSTMSLILSCPVVEQYTKCDL